MNRRFVAKEDWGPSPSEQPLREGTRARVTIHVGGEGIGIEGDMDVTAVWRRGHWIDTQTGQPLDNYQVKSYRTL